MSTITVAPYCALQALLGHSAHSIQNLASSMTESYSDNVTSHYLIIILLQFIDANRSLPAVHRCSKQAEHPLASLLIVGEPPVTLHRNCRGIVKARRLHRGLVGAISHRCSSRLTNRPAIGTRRNLPSPSFQRGGTWNLEASSSASSCG